jgi:homopolymeric O-antigen transport system permease protein
MKTPALWSDLREALALRSAIVAYALADLRIRFDRTALGPGWLILTNFIWVLSVGFVMTKLFKQSLAEQLPYLTFGVFAWSYIFTVLTESPTVFHAYKQLLLGYRIPLTFCVLRVAVRNVIILMMLTVISFSISMWYGLCSIATLFSVPAVVILYFVLSVPLILVLAIVGTKFVDLDQLIRIVLNILVIVTPIFWHKTMLPQTHPLIILNPIAHTIDLYRDTFLTGSASIGTYGLVLLTTIGLWALAFLLFELKARRVKNWL